jgi:hypothetical protein
MKRIIGWVAVVLGLLVAGAAATVVRPTGAPDYTADAPTLWDQGYVEHQTEAVINMPRDVFQAWFKENELVTFLEPVGSIPQIEGTTMIAGEWFKHGGKRRVVFAGGDTAVERVLVFTPEVFRYQIWGFTTSARYVVDHVQGEIAFVAEGTAQTRVIWTYRIAPKTFFTRPLVARMMTSEFAPFMDQGLAAMAEAANAGG